ncbi:MAG: M57 family metalloprotease [Bacteroidia bacterium]
MYRLIRFLTCGLLLMGWTFGQVIDNASVNTRQKTRSVRLLKPYEPFPHGKSGSIAQPFGNQFLPQRGNHHSGDGRVLPLNANGNLISPDGEEVTFVIPRHAYGKGGCATPVPMIVNSSGASRANCPIEVSCDLAVNRNAKIPTVGQAVKWIKIRWTVVQNGGAASNVNQAQLDLLLAEVRADFQPFGLDFCADPAQFVTSATYYDINVSTEDAGLKGTYGANYSQVLNVYVVNNINLSATSGAGGYARFPYDPLGGTSVRGGIVLARSNAATGSHTLSHELGHAFGLHHTFRGVDEVATCSNCYERVDNVNGTSNNGDTEGDWCGDTNPHPANTYNCFDPAGPGNVCDAFTWNNTPVDNHMSYSFCSTTFSQHQSGRMHCMIDAYLSSWTTFGSVTCGAQPPVANFSGNPTRYQAPSTVTFTDQSQPPQLITAWNWDFDFANAGGVTPATFTGQNPPAVVYANPGLYTVRLIVSNANGNDTLIRTDYIEVLAPAADCDTLFTKFATPFPTLRAYQWAANDYLTGVPNTLGEYGYFERYFTPTPGVTTVGAMFVGLTGFLDADSSMLLDFVVYNDDGNGEPFLAQGPIGGLNNVRPGQDLSVPAAPFFTEIWIPFFVPVTIDSSRFHIGVEIRNNDAVDRIQILSSTVGQGQLNGDNHLVANRATPAISNYLADVSTPTFSIDFDLELIPALGEWTAVPIVNFLDTAGCDTSIVLVVDTFLFSSTLTNISFDFDTLGLVTGDSTNDVANIFVRYTQAGPDTFDVSFINSCGRGDTVAFIVDYRFNESPVADFSMNRISPVCKDSVIIFSGTPTGATVQIYNWDFGDGTNSSTASPTISHTYTAPGLYYVSLTVTDTAGCDDVEQKLGFVEVVDCAITPPATAFTVNPTSGCDFDVFTFTDNTPVAPSPATSWLWDFGDGTFSNQQNPTHTYTVAGTYTVRLLASNDGGTTGQTFSLVVNACPQSLDAQIAAKAQGPYIRLDWEQTVEGASRMYRLQRSLDGRSFEALTDVVSIGPGRYVEWDRNLPQVDVLYYRLQAIELDGSFARSNIATVVRGNAPGIWMQAHPNPLPQGSLLNVFVFVPKEGLELRLMDGTGRQVKRSLMPEATGGTEVSISTEGLAPGMYFLEAQDGQGEQAVLKVIVN